MPEALEWDVWQPARPMEALAAHPLINPSAFLWAVAAAAVVEAAAVLLALQPFSLPVAAAVLLALQLASLLLDSPVRPVVAPRCPATFLSAEFRPTILVAIWILRATHGTTSRHTRPERRRSNCLHSQPILD